MPDKTKIAVAEGPPHMTKTPVQVCFEDAECEALDNYRRQQANPPSRARAARDLIRLALSERGGSRPHHQRAGELAASP
jgi:hypothetical protein